MERSVASHDLESGLLVTNGVSNSQDSFGVGNPLQGMFTGIKKFMTTQYENLLYYVNNAGTYWLFFWAGLTVVLWIVGK